MTSPDLTKLDALYEAATAPESDFQDVIRAKTALFNEYPSIRAEMEALREALSKIDPLTQYSDGNPNGQLFAVQQIVRELRTALNKEVGDND